MTRDIETGDRVVVTDDMGSADPGTVLDIVGNMYFVAFDEGWKAWINNYGVFLLDEEEK